MRQTYVKLRLDLFLYRIPNLFFPKHLAKGSKSVKINAQPTTLKKSNWSKSIGDQAGVAKGIISNKVADKTEFISYSFDIKIEAQDVVRHADMTTHNAKNTVGMAYGSSTAPATIEEEDLSCPYCGKPEHNTARKRGTHIGSGQALRKNIIDPIENHQWYTGPNSLQAHHLICSEAMDDEGWSEYCPSFGYSINHQNNGVMLPNEMALACQLHVALHRGNHRQGRAHGEPYPKKIKRELEKIANQIRSGKYCDNPKGLVDELDDFSHYILGKIDKFKWTITADGRDYDSGNRGCAGVSSLSDKPNNSCPHNRVHDLRKENESTTLPRKSVPLQIGQ